jgi:hypothetical protein
MTTALLQNVWNGILAYDLTPDNKRWLAERLWQQAEEESKEDIKPYTMAELNARIDRAEASIAAGRVHSRDEISRMMNDFVAQYE